MSKSKKKRSKKYSGVDAKQPDNLVRVRRVEAVARSDRAQWFHDHRKLIKRVTIGVIIAAAVIFLIVEGAIALSH